LASAPRSASHANGTGANGPLTSKAPISSIDSPDLTSAFCVAGIGAVSIITGQRERYLPRLATGELRATMALTEPGGGSDLQAMRTTARADGDAWVVTGSKSWISNARRAGLIALLCTTDPDADPPHRGMSILLVAAQTRPHRRAGPAEARLQGRGELRGRARRLSGSAARRPGRRPGRGFAQMMRRLDLGRIQAAARAVGVGRAAFEDALRYAQERESLGVPPGSPPPDNSSCTPPTASTPASGPTSRPAWPSRSPPRAPCRSHWTRCGCTAGTALHRVRRGAVLPGCAADDHDTQSLPI
jgi:hypothetical protein